MPTITGRVSSGLGDFAQWIEKFQDHYREKTGLTLYPGTLNLRLDITYRLPSNPIRLDPSEYGGAVGVSLVPCQVFGHRAFILRTDANERGDGDHPREVIEVATDIKLRDVYHLKDGDLVSVHIED